MRKMSEHYVFTSRLKLLIIMVSAYLKGCPLGKYRKQAIAENANQVFYHSLQLASKYAALKNHVCFIKEFNSLRSWQKHWSETAP